MVQIFLKLLQRLRQFLLWIWQQEGTPAQRARGMALGVFSGCFPFFGIQTLLGVMLASLFRGNRLLAATGTWISNPFTYLPLYWLNYKVGSSLLRDNSAVPELTTLTRQEMWDQGWFFSSRLLLGSTVMGMTLGLIIGLSLYFILNFLSKE
tara:strand:- start:705 stop:1157 length:453 start_codon:yes stop_codon:yes gene_type:complete